MPRRPSRRQPAAALLLAALLLTALMSACAPGGSVALGEPPTDDSGEAPPLPADSRSCALVSDLDDPNLLEGDAVSFGLTCVGDLPQDEAEISMVSAPVGVTFDLDAMRVSWQTGPADAGRWELVFQSKPRGSGEIPRSSAVTLWVTDDPSARDNEPVDPLTYTEEWGLPVMHIDPRGSLSETYTDAALTFMGREYSAEIKVRGAASASYPKNSFTLNFDEEELEIDAWGTSREHLILVTSFDDNSYVRQKLIYDQWAAMAEFWGDEARLTPRTFFVVVYLDGEYFGLYTALDRVDDEFMRHMGYAGEGNLYKAVNHEANFALTGSSGSPKSDLASGYEKKEGEPADDYDDLRALVDFTGNASDSQLLNGAAGWLDIDEFMDWQLLVVYSSSGDSAGKNAYLYNEGDGAGFRYVPWDFNHAWGQNWYTARIDARDYDDFTSRNRVFDAIERSGSAELWGRLDAMRAPGGPFDPAWLRDTVDSYYAQIDRSAQRDWERWEGEYRSYSRWSSTRSSYNDWEDFEGEREYLYDWLDERAAFFEEIVP